MLPPVADDVRPFGPYAEIVQVSSVAKVCFYVSLADLNDCGVVLRNAEEFPSMVRVCHSKKHGLVRLKPNVLAYPVADSWIIVELHSVLGWVNVPCFWKALS